VVEINRLLKQYEMMQQMLSGKWPRRQKDEKIRKKRPSARLRVMTRDGLPVRRLTYESMEYGGENTWLR
jgi:hypothetical protein